MEIGRIKPPVFTVQDVKKSLLKSKLSLVWLSFTQALTNILYNILCVLWMPVLFLGCFFMDTDAFMTSINSLSKGIFGEYLKK